MSDTNLNEQGAENAAEVSSAESSEQGIEQTSETHDNLSDVDNYEFFDENGMVRNRIVNTVPGFNREERIALRESGRFWPGFFASVDEWF